MRRVTINYKQKVIFHAIIVEQNRCSSRSCDFDFASEYWTGKFEPRSWSPMKNHGDIKFIFIHSFQGTSRSRPVQPGSLPRGHKTAPRLAWPRARYLRRVLHTITKHHNCSTKIDVKTDQFITVGMPYSISTLAQTTNSCSSD